jgi:hypothetical protein
MGDLNRKTAAPFWVISCVLSAMCERVSRHVTYAGYFGPKAIEILFNHLERAKLIKQTKFRGLVILVFASAILGFVASRGHFTKKKE